MVKTCNKCGEEKDTTEFHLSKRDGNQSWCRKCSLIRTKNYDAKSRKFVGWIKTSIGCADCKEHFYDNPECLAFDHVKGTKKFSMHSWHGGIKRLQEEIMKCDIVCHNCHEIRSTKRGKANFTYDQDNSRTDYSS